MKSIPFTNEQVEILKQNLYTADVTAQRIRYTLDFKIFVMKQVQAGLTSTNIFKKAGYDPEILGKQRIYMTVKNIKKEAASPDGLRSPRTVKQAERFAQEELSKKRTSTAVRELQERVIYLEQEIEFLKKTSLLLKEFEKDI